VAGPLAAGAGGDGRAARQSTGASDAPRLPGALGQAAALCQPVEASLKTAAPAGFSADAVGARQFLTATAWLLE
jgi:hypothetical protein